MADTESAAPVSSRRVGCGAAGDAGGVRSDSALKGSEGSVQSFVRSSRSCAADGLVRFKPIPENIDAEAGGD
eukprot:CAMPEP_0177675198 /NCGR_PEP_ID=MMETSP0447-20121125/27041_1 /TAXON_ID=0 /ORGANISM="Stygamoeba regulata, Strain BSH-02190019" /LENGTH=71 /DNA_ID=CAMNT_0019183505 /DNA_START=324 /DNA_END=539 /DNA_ORIENTATION=-